MREKGQGRMLGEATLLGCAEQEKSCKDSPGLLFTALFFCVLVMVKGVFCLSAGQMTIFGRYLLKVFKCSLQIFDDIVCILSADGEADGVLSDTLLLQLFLVILGMRGGCGMDSQRLNICYIS